MVTIRPIPKTEVRCNACNSLIGHIIRESPDEELIIEYVEGVTGVFQRFRMYDVEDDGVPMYEHEFEVDLCPDCTKKFGKIIKKFKLNRSKVSRSSAPSAKEEGG